MRLVASSASPGAFLVELEPHADERGFFARTFCAREFAAAGLDARDRRSRSVSCNRAARHAARPALPGARRTRRRSSCAARAARSTTWSSTCGRTRPPSAGTSASSSRADERDGALRPARASPTASRPSSDDAEVFYSDVGAATRPRPRAACAGTTRPSPSPGRSRCAVISERDAALSRSRSRAAMGGVTPCRRRASAASARGDRRRPARPRRAPLPDSAQHHRRRRARDACAILARARSRSTDPRGADAARRSSTGRCRGSGTSARRLDPRSRRRDGSPTSRGTTSTLVGYSVPVRARLPLAELRRTCTRCPEQPDLDPVPHRLLRGALGLLPAAPRRSRRCPRASTRCVIDADARGRQPHLRRARAARRDASDEVLISTHVCHPSLANDNLSGMVVATALAARARRRDRARRLPTASCSCPARSARSPGWRRNRRRARRDPPRPGRSPASATPGRLPLQAQPRAATPRSTAPLPRALRGAAARRSRSRTSPRTATTSASTARPASTCRSARSRARRTAATPSTTPRPTTSTSSGPTRSPTRSRRYARDRRRARGATRATATSRPTASRSSAGAASTARSAATTHGRERELALLWVLNLSDGDHSLVDIAERSRIAARSRSAKRRRARRSRPARRGLSPSKKHAGTPGRVSPDRRGERRVTSRRPGRRCGR